MERIRIDTGIKEIEVNDSGDSIQIPVNDTAFYKRFVEALKRIEEKQAEIDRRSKELSEKYPEKEPGDGREEKQEKDSEINMEMFGDALGLYSEVCRETCLEIDSIFGEGCCSKVFPGVKEPGIDMIMGFFEQILPIMEKFMDEKKKNMIQKYGKKRRGGGR